MSEDSHPPKTFPGLDRPMAIPAWAPWLGALLAFLLLGLPMVHMQYELLHAQEDLISQLAPNLPPPWPGALTQDAGHWAALLWPELYPRGEDGQWMLDNAPFGREITWSRLFLGYASLSRWLAAIVAPDDPQTAFAPIFRMMNLPLLAAFLGLLVWIGVHYYSRLSALVGVLFASGFFVFVEEFGYAQPDHHSLLNLLGLGLFLGIGAALTLATREEPTEDERTLFRRCRRLLVFSALCGALGLWVLATQVLPAIALLGFGLTLALIVVPRADLPCGLRPVLWRWWAFSGAAFSLVFYMIQFFPDLARTGLETLHPLWALAWAAGGEWLYRLHRFRLGLAKPLRDGGGVLVSAMVGATPFLLILLGGAHWHIMRDPLIYRVHRYIEGFEPLTLPGIESSGGILSFYILLVFPGLAALLALPLLTWGDARTRLRLLPLAVVALLFWLLPFYQSRWAGYCAVAQLALLPVLLDSARALPFWSRARLGTGITLVLAAFFSALGTLHFARTHGADRSSVVTEATNYIAARTIQQHLAETPSPVVLMARHTPVAQQFQLWTRLPVVGSLFWENAPGFRDELAFFTAKDPAIAREILEHRRVTHVIVASRVEVVQKTLTYAGLPTDPAAAQQTLIFRLAAPRPHPPDYLELMEIGHPAIEVSDIRVYRVIPPPAPEGA